MAGIDGSKIVSAYLRLDGTGTNQVTANYSDAGLGAAAFWVGPTVASGEVWTIARLLIFIQDTGAMDAGDYANGVALTNGLTFKVKKLNGDGATFTDYALIGGDTIKTNGEWGGHVYDVQVASWGTGDEVLFARWTFRNYGDPYGLRLNPGDRFQLDVNDDFSGLVEHTFYANGVKRGAAL